MVPFYVLLLQNKAIPSPGQGGGFSPLVLLELLEIFTPSKITIFGGV